MIYIAGQITTLIVVSMIFSMTDAWIFTDYQSSPIMLSFIARAVCDLISTIAIAWNLKQKRDSSIKEYDLCIALSILTIIGPRTIIIIDQLILWTIGKICSTFMNSFRTSPLHRNWADHQVLRSFMDYIYMVFDLSV
jgi:hypothetical protein